MQYFDRKKRGKKSFFTKYTISSETRKCFQLFARYDGWYWLTLLRIVMTCLKGEALRRRIASQSRKARTCKVKRILPLFFTRLLLGVETSTILTLRVNSTDRTKMCITLNVVQYLYISTSIALDLKSYISIVSDFFLEKRNWKIQFYLVWNKIGWKSEWRNLKWDSLKWLGDHFSWIALLFELGATSWALCVRGCWQTPTSSFPTESDRSNGARKVQCSHVYLTAQHLFLNQSAIVWNFQMPI